jgi:hypothetical protein
MRRNYINSGIGNGEFGIGWNKMMKGTVTDVDLTAGEIQDFGVFRMKSQITNYKFPIPFCFVNSPLHKWGCIGFDSIDL